ncbi:MAG: VCBS repeat-containing protein, partial [Verrucomicrobiales bacterium]|nr:VCBS repeat-containing protein [Verrucomicrobiales bacterium]
ILWRNNSTGRVIVWYMDGTTSTGTAVVWAASAVGDALWVPIATGDFNADSKIDIIWRNSATGRVIVWIMDGATRTSTTTLWNPATTADTLWVPYATGDFNADSKIDIIWRNSSTGRVIVWYMNGTTRTSTANLWTPASAADTLWVPVATGDFNADSKTDIVWRNSSTGRGIIWMMNGVTRTSTTTVWAASGPTDYLWVPMATGDFDASGAPDLVWRNSSTGRVIAWMLTGTTTSTTAVLWSP